VSSKLQHALEELYGLERRKDKLGLDGTRELLAALGNPERRFRSVHVAGTNGKGSVCAIVERVLRIAGHRTGLFTSPHLVDFRERIRVNGRWADEAWLEQALARIQALPEGKGRTFFEVVTALGFLYFAEQGVEWAVVEVGLGGRLDTTNVLVPEVCAITSIGMDHGEILGDTIERIAAEKAGIAKPGVPLILGAEDPVARATIESIALRVGAIVPASRTHLVHLTEVTSGQERRQTTLVLPSEDEITLVHGSLGDRFGHNAGVAVEILMTLDERSIRVPREAIAEGLATARWPGRLEPCPTSSNLWWDGAHNDQAFRELGSAWFHLFGLDSPAVIVLALGRDKDAPAILDAIQVGFAEPIPNEKMRRVIGMGDVGEEASGSEAMRDISELMREALEEGPEGYVRPRLVVTRTRSERAREPGDLAELAAARGYVVEIAPNVPEATKRALALVGDGKVLLTGSLFAVGEAMEAFGGAPGEQL